MTSILTELTNTNKQEVLNSKRNVSQFDLEQNQNSIKMKETQTTTDDLISNMSI